MYTQVVSTLQRIRCYLYTIPPSSKISREELLILPFHLQGNLITTRKRQRKRWIVLQSYNKR